MTFHYRFHKITLGRNSISILRHGQDDDKATHIEADGDVKKLTDLAKGYVDSMVQQ